MPQASCQILSFIFNAVIRSLGVFMGGETTAPGCQCANRHLKFECWFQAVLMLLEYRANMESEMWMVQSFCLIPGKD